MKNNCPHCNEQIKLEVEETEVNSNATQAILYCYCKVCGYQWQEEYNMTYKKTSFIDGPR